MNFVIAVAHHCLNLPRTFSQPGKHSFGDPCATHKFCHSTFPLVSSQINIVTYVALFNKFIFRRIPYCLMSDGRNFENFPYLVNGISQWIFISIWHRGKNLKYLCQNGWCVFYSKRHNNFISSLLIILGKRLTASKKICVEDGVVMLYGFNWSVYLILLHGRDAFWYSISNNTHEQTQIL